MLEALLREGCINETVSATLAERALAGATEPAVREALAVVVADETRHAAYAWRCARWVLQQHPELRRMVAPLVGHARATAARAGNRDRAGVPACGLLSDADRGRAHRGAGRAVIDPAVDAPQASVPGPVVAEA